MRKWSILFASGAVLLLILVNLSSCKKNNEFVKPKLSLSSADLTVKESDGLIKLTMALDRKATEDVHVAYTVTGTATDKVAAGSGGGYDYEIKTPYLETTIKKDSVVGQISIQLYSDFSFEDDETITIHIKSVDTDNIEITSNNDETVTIKQEDGLAVFLAWGVGTGEHYTDVDMDLFLWAKNTSDQLALTNVFSANASTTSPEFLFLPVALLPDGQYGLSANYYGGTVDPMNWEFDYITYINSTEGEPVTKKASYHLDNINAWDVTETDPLLVATFNKAGTSFSTFSDIDVPDTGSRIGSSHNPILKTLSRQAPVDKVMPAFKHR